MKNIQIQKVKSRYKVKLHYETKDEEQTFDNADDLLDFVGEFLKNDSYEVSNIKELKSKIKELEAKKDKL